MYVVAQVGPLRSCADDGDVQIRVAIVDDHELRPAGSCIPSRRARRRRGVSVDRCCSVALIGLNGPITTVIRADVDAGALMGFGHARHSRADRKAPHRSEPPRRLRSCPRDSPHTMDRGLENGL